MKIALKCLFFILLLIQFAYAQQKPVKDSATTMNEVVITAFEQNREVSCGTIVKVISKTSSDWCNKSSLVNAFNTVAGVRMEERSPSSYRINIRGSSLRSPFGVRNIKCYWNDIPMTDPGGNTYFNQFSFNNFSTIEIVKGPAGSMYGAGTGGLLLMHSFENAWKPSINFEYIGGSYGLKNIFTSAGFGKQNSRSLVTYAHNESNGYRNHTRSKRDNVSFISKFKLSEKQELTAGILYNDMFYETPGGLTKTEFMANPKQARPAIPGLPSADAAKAAIYQKNFTLGINHIYNFASGFNNSTSIYGTFAQIKNPTFRNYERRNEPSFGARTTFVYDKRINETQLKIVVGGEWQEALFNTQVSKNRNGNPDTLQTDDDIKYITYSVFTQADIKFKGGWIITVGASSNKSKVDFSRLNVYPVLKQDRTYKSEISPRLAFQKKINKNNTVFASVSKGFSPPSISELLPSTGVISTFLEAEEGINYELGGKFSFLKHKLNLEATGYYFKLYNALVTRKDSSNADYYVNAGNTRQEGIELSADYTSSFSKSRIIDQVNIGSAYTFSDYEYGDFKKGKTDFSGKSLPSVPKNTLSILADIQFKKGIYLNSTYYYATKIFLDDANSFAADAYHLLGCRIGWKLALHTNVLVNFYTGVDNLLDESYSLGNDINAAAGRYYNPAPKRNYYLGVRFQLSQKTLDVKK
jgi:iron complex outermembrane receptor protein